ncbi:MAG: KamA family radical SAM protein [Mahellales bacterium]|jgi:glutamate 2,3-aminomutase
MKEDNCHCSGQYDSRSKELRAKIQHYLAAAKDIDTGFKLKNVFAENKRRIMDLLSADEEQWNDWKWQLGNRITTVEMMKRFIPLSNREIDNIERVGKRYRWAISPYYLSLMDSKNSSCPIRMQAVPTIQELKEDGDADPMAEEATSPVAGVVRRYPDRLIIKVTNSCGMFCRHCQRRRSIGDRDRQASFTQLKAAIRYIKQHGEIRDVLLTGGDGLLINDQLLDWILGELREIPTVEIIRIGTRTLVTMPQRITDDLCRVLERYHPIYINTHFNHPREITLDAAQAADKLTRAGVPLGNQAVLLKGINDDVSIMKKLNHELLKIRIRPYYIFHPVNTTGTQHFHVKIQRGMEIMEGLRGYTSGLANPVYIVNAPGGYGKIPVMPNYILSWGTDHVILRTWEGKVFRYPN